jgi:hypothetical protein
MSVIDLYYPVEAREPKDDCEAPALPTQIVTEEELSLEDFIHEYQDDPASFKSVQIIPPRIGGPVGGAVRVVYVAPRLRLRSHQGVGVPTAPADP